jgi:hypothetical protein
MAAKLTRLTHKIAIQLRLVAESCIICSSRCRRPVRKLLDTISYVKQYRHVCILSSFNIFVSPLLLPPPLFCILYTEFLCTRQSCQPSLCTADIPNIYILPKNITIIEILERSYA